ncbi:MAG: coenzyme F420-0:L-glutamate ligase [Candidatus Thiodiazotropha sp. (ex Ustalcina ferruginea)]|nr:coenzyme F420-0:L-glutamate ligase [Candidatus Thiodiazotropha sp. (ex Ustalcina ferruginea)]
MAPSTIPLIKPGDDLAAILIQTMKDQGLAWEDRDILVIAQKIVSKAEGRYVRLDDVQPSAEALRLARICQKDPRLVELILEESTSVVRATPHVLIVRHRLGFISANAGIDHSNIDDGHQQVLLLPENPDASAQALRERIQQQTGLSPGVVINDSFGRPWRLGTCGVCIGSSGIVTLKDFRGAQDLSGQRLEVTEVAWGDELAAAASLLMGATNEARPVVIVRGLSITGSGDGADLIRPLAEDLFL